MRSRSCSSLSHACSIAVTRASLVRRDETTMAQPEFRGLPPETAVSLCDVAQLRCESEGAELFQALVLDLPDPLARHVERPADLVQRPGLLAVEPVAQLEDAPLAVRERLEDRAQRFVPQRLLSLLVRQRHRLVGEEVPELGL